MKKINSEQLLKVIEEFQNILNSELPYGEQFNGNIIQWIEKQIKKYSDDKDATILLQKNFFEIAIRYSSKADFVSLNKVNADKVIIHFSKPSFSNNIKLQLKEGIEDAQIINLFRILSEELNVFDNTYEEIKIMLMEVFDFGHDNIYSYFQRADKKRKPKKLFKVDWEELY